MDRGGWWRLAGRGQFHSPAALRTAAAVVRNGIETAPSVAELVPNSALPAAQYSCTLLPQIRHIPTVLSPGPALLTNPILMVKNRRKLIDLNLVILLAATIVPPLAIFKTKC